MSKSKAQELLDELNSDPGNSSLVFYDALVDKDGNPTFLFSHAREIHISKMEDING